MMTGWTLAFRGLQHHWRTHLGVFLGATLAVAILVGALLVGDSVRYSLREMALARLGGTHLVLNGQSRFFRTTLADEIAADQKLPVAPAVLLRGVAVAGGGQARVGRVQVMGVDRRFWELGGRAPAGADRADGVVLNERLAARLGAKAGDEVLLRVDKPSLLSRDAPLSTLEDAKVALRLPVAGIATEGEFGRFSLEANQVPPLNAFVPLRLLQEKISLRDRVNVLLVGAVGAAPDPAAVGTSLRKHWQLADAGLELRELPDLGLLELRTERIFVEPQVGDAALRAAPGASGILSYFVNELRVGPRATPYSVVAAMRASFGPPELADDEILINSWLADDLQAHPGDRLSLSYFLVGARRQLERRSSTFRVREIVPLQGVAADRRLMPDYPGVADSPNCRDWKPGIPIDLDRIRDKDEAYWDAYRGTPKAFISLAAGQRLWNNRFGNLTAVRYPLQGNTGETVEAHLREAIDPASTGLFFVPVREQALRASSQSLDFGGLFLGFSFFLIAAALVLMALLFGLGVEQRSEEVGILLAVGYTPGQVRRLLLAEGAGIAFAASVLGAVLSALYTRAVVRGLSTVWRGAVADSVLRFHAQPATALGGAAGGFVVALLTVWLVARKQARLPARELLAPAGVASADPGKPGRRRWLPGVPTAVLAGGGGLVLTGLAATLSPEKAAEPFFGAGFLLLLGGIGACRALLARLERSAGASRLTLGTLGMRNTVRRGGRSLSAVTLLSAGSFLVVAVGASRHDPNAGARERTSGTGGFALYAESTLPVYDDLNTPSGREAYGLDAEDLAGCQVIPLRLREGDEASCLNLNRAQSPRVLGVDTRTFRKLRPFAFGQRKGGSAADPWSVLDQDLGRSEIPAVGDENTVVWSLRKGLGDAVEMTDDRGSPVRLRIVGVLGNAVLQGSLLISEKQFITHFPNQSGYQVFLIDAPDDRTTAVEQTLGRALEDVGMDLTPAPERLAAFNNVENTYLSIFAVLGGLGLLLGSAGLGVIVLRNVLERRGELALLRAVGFRTRALHWLIFSEHALLLVLGLALGVLTALVAVLPSLRTPAAEVPVLSLALTLTCVFVSGFLWTWIATGAALRGPLMSALRSE